MPSVPPPASNPKNIDDLLSAGTRRRPPQPPASAELSAPIPAPVPRPEPPVPVTAPALQPESPGIRRGTFQLTVENDLHLHQLSYHTPGSRGDKSYIVNKALEEYLAKHPKSREGIPEEDAVRRRGRRHH